MHLRHISLTNFRIYARLELELPPGPILIHGDNAQGKTSLLEAIYYLATAHSPHTSSDRQLIHWLAGDEGITPYARLVGDVSRNDRAAHIEMTLMLEPSNNEQGNRFRKQIKLNGTTQRAGDLSGEVNVVLFLPQDVETAGGSPGLRRRYLNDAISQIDPEYARIVDRYGDVLSQRNALLKALNEQGGDPDQLDYWDQQLATDGATITLKRQIILEELSRIADRIHRDLTGGTADLRLRYRPAFNPNHTPDNEYQIALDLDAPPNDITRLTDPARARDAAAIFRAQLHERRSDEITRGMTLIGPHRDDFQIISDQIDLGTYGSRGQQRSAMLALKLAEVEWIHQKVGDWPILLLDEVMAELDARRRDYLQARILDAHQSLSTSTDPTLFSDTFRARARLLRVIRGRIEP